MTAFADLGLAGVEVDVLGPSEARRVLGARRAAARRADAVPDGWIYRYRHPDTGWRLSVATLAPPRSGKLSLGGFRIAPESRTAIDGYDNDREAIGLAVGMEEKVHWSRVLRVGGPLALRNLDRIVGGKCVLLPTPEARIGRARDHELLDFAVACLRDVDGVAGIHVTTGQDLGHGTMSDGVTPSLAYMHARFDGSVLADTSKPTGEGNYQLLCGMLAGAGVAVSSARVALVGAGNVGQHILGRLRESGVRTTVVDAAPETRARLATMGIVALGPEDKLALLSSAIDAVVVNAAGGSLDDATVQTIAFNRAVRVVCGSENLAMPNPANERVLSSAGKVYAHPELGGMMGYLTAVEECLARRARVPFDAGTLLAASERLYDVGREATERVIRSGYRASFQDAARALGSIPPRVPSRP